MSQPSRQEQFSGTKDVAPQHALDAAKLARYLSENVPGFEGPLTIRRLPAEIETVIEATPRIGIRHAAELPLRFLIAGSRFASR